MKFGEFVHGTTGVGNHRAGELQGWGTAELARSVRFRQVTGTGVRDDRPIHSRIHWDTDPGGAVFGDPRVGQSEPVGQGDPGVKQGALLSGLPLFLRSRREDHGLNGNVWVAWEVWVLGLEFPGLTGGRFAFDSKAKGQGGDAAPRRGRRPEVVDGRTWVLGANGSRAEGCRKVGSSATGPGLLAPGPLTAFRAPAFQAPDSHAREYRLRRRGPQSNRAVGRPGDGVTVGFRRALRRRGCCNAERLPRNGGYWLRRGGRRSGPMGVA